MWNYSEALFKQMHHQAKRMVQDDSGVTSIEYALIGALIAVVIVGGVTNVGTAVTALYDMVAEEVAKAVSGP